VKVRVIVRVIARVAVNLGGSCGVGALLELLDLLLEIAHLPSEQQVVSPSRTEERPPSGFRAEDNGGLSSVLLGRTACSSPTCRAKKEQLGS
jgi:hypothetical protein